MPVGAINIGWGPIGISFEAFACVTVDGDVVVFPWNSDNGFILHCIDIWHVGICHMAGFSQSLPIKME